jgi:hypothetical protein
MGCQWAALYYPIFWSAVFLMLSILLIPKFVLMFSKKQYSYKNFISEKGLINCIAWVLLDLCRVHVVWFGFLGYLIYLVSCPWLIGQVFTDGGNRGYMTCMGWLVKIFNSKEKHDYIGSPDIMVVVLPHFFFVVIPSILVAGALAAERGIYKEHFLSLSGKKEDDDSSQKNKRSGTYDNHRHRRSKFDFVERWIRKVLLAACLVICWKHFTVRINSVPFYVHNMSVKKCMHCISSRHRGRIHYFTRKLKLMDYYTSKSLIALVSRLLACAV